jgi:hypothetical protein
VKNLFEIVARDGESPLIAVWNVGPETVSTIYLSRPDMGRPGHLIETRCIKGRDDRGPRRRFHATLRDAILAHVKRTQDRQWAASKAVAESRRAHRAALDLWNGSAATPEVVAMS